MPEEEIQRYTVSHTTQYDFSAPVFLEPHFLRFKPKTTAHQRLTSFQLAIDPHPVGHSEITGPQDNLAQSCWFENEHRRLRVHAHSEVDVVQYNPFDFLILPITARHLGQHYSNDLLPLLGIYLEHEPATEDLRQYAEKLLKDTSFEILGFLIELNQQIHQDFQKEMRHSGPAHHPSQTFGSRSGSCRDLTVLFMHICRNYGLASRFVSGYLYHDELEDSHELHAWAEVYLPGGGWRGFDPTVGLATSGIHIAVATSHNADFTMPVKGTFRGEAEARLTTSVTVARLNS